MKDVVDSEVEQLMDKLKTLEKLYDFLRFVDPVKKDVIAFTGDGLSATGDKCFETWQKGKLCENCISARAYNDNRTYVKIEYNAQKILMVTAMPIMLKDRIVVLELLKDVSKSFLVENADSNRVMEIHSLLEQLNLVALKDGLTDAYNRRFIDERLPVDIVHAVINGEELSVIIGDLDNFKYINDTYGHLAGDQMIQKFSKILEYCIRRNTDWVARYGGDEFIIALPNTDLDAAFSAAERMRRTLAEEQFVIGGEMVQITASYGVTSIKELENKTLEAMIEGADKKLYLAKQKGRNRVEK